MLSRLRTEIGDFLGTVEEDGLKSGTRSPIRSGSRSPTKSVRSGRSPAAGGMSPYKRRGGERATLRAEDLPDINIPSRFALEFRKLSSEEVVGLKNLIIALSEKLRLMRL